MEVAGVIILIAIGFTVLGYFICAFVKQDSYDKMISDEEQCKFLEQWREKHPNFKSGKK